MARPGGSELGQEGRVDNLDLKNAGLAGTLPPSLPSLAALRDLSLQGNSLSGALPSFRGMASLRRAFLNDNDFDAIPPNFFDALADLLEISLANNPRLNDLPVGGARRGSRAGLGSAKRGLRRGW